VTAGSGGSPKRTGMDTEEARVTGEVARRAARRLDVLEWVILLVVALLSVAAGALVALLLARPLSISFRLTWTVASLVIFGVPGWFAMRRSRREEDALRDRILRQIGGEDG
jgi:hypothetical protein